MAIRLYTHDGFALLKNKFSGDHITSLTSKNVRAIHRLLHRRPCDDDDDAQIAAATTSVNVSSDDSTITTTTTIRRVAHRIMSLRGHIHDMAAKLPSCLPRVAAAANGAKKNHALKTPCRRGGDVCCDYLESLKMYLHGMIHDLYLTAFMLLPTPTSGSLMRIILMAGHCYGSMDPVSNIIVNSIWYNKHCCPLSESDCYCWD